MSEDISRFGPKDVQKVAEAIIGIPPKSKQVIKFKQPWTSKIVLVFKLLVSLFQLRFGLFDNQYVFQAAASKLTTALHLAKYDPGLQHVLNSPTKEK